MKILQVDGPGDQASQCEGIANSIYPHLDYGMYRILDGVQAGRLRLCVATDADEVVGFATLGGLHLPGRLVRIFVDPQKTQRGIGSALMEEALGQVPVGAAVRSIVTVNDPRSVAFAERYGFICDDDDPEYELDLLWRGPSALPPAPSHISPLGTWIAKAASDLRK